MSTSAVDQPMTAQMLNNKIVKLKPTVHLAKRALLNQLGRKIHQFQYKISKSDDVHLKHKEKNQGKVLRLEQDIEAVKKLSSRDVAKFALINTKSLLDFKISDKTEPAKRALYRLATSGIVQDSVTEFRTQFPNWFQEVPFFLQRLGRQYAKKHEKAQLSAEVRQKLLEDQNDAGLTKQASSSIGEAEATNEGKRLEPEKPLISPPKTKKASSKIQSKEAGAIANIAPEPEKVKAQKKKAKTKERVPTPEPEPEDFSRKNGRRSKGDVKSKSDRISVAISPEPQKVKLPPAKSVDIVSSLVQDELKTAIKSAKTKLDKEKKKKKKKSESVKTAVAKAVAPVAYMEKRLASTVKLSVEGRIGEMEIRKIDLSRQSPASDDDVIVPQKSAEDKAKFLPEPKPALVHDSFFLSGDAADDECGAELPFADVTEEEVIKSGRRAKESAPYKIGQGKKMKSQFTSSLSGAAANGGDEEPHELAPRGNPFRLPQSQRPSGRMQTYDYGEGRKCGKKALRALEERTRQIEEKSRAHSRKPRQDRHVSSSHDSVATNIQGRKATTEPSHGKQRVQKHGQMQSVPRGEDQAGLHPSWLAKRKEKQLLHAGPQGKKIKFADDD